MAENSKTGQSPVVASSSKTGSGFNLGLLLGVLAYLAFLKRAAIAAALKILKSQTQA